MIGILIVTHCRLGESLIEAAEFILQRRPESCEAVSIDPKDGAEKLKAKIQKGIKKVKGPGGVLILTDMFGGTPSNLGYSFLEEGKIEVLSGVNLPMLVKAASVRSELKLSRLAAELEEAGKKSISLASSILKGNKKS